MTQMCNATCICTVHLFYAVNNTDMEKQIKILKEFEQKTWITKSGDKIQIKELSINHLENIIKYLKKKYNELENPMNDYPSFNGEMAQIHAENQWVSDIQHYKQLERNIELFECYYRLKNL